MCCYSPTLDTDVRTEGGLNTAATRGFPPFRQTRPYEINKMTSSAACNWQGDVMSGDFTCVHLSQNSAAVFSPLFLRRRRHEA